VILKGPGILYVDAEPIVKVTRKDMDAVTALACDIPQRRARLCTHHSPDEPMHEMLICHTRNYLRPHKHFDKGESFHVIEGMADVVLFDEAGQVIDVIKLGEYRTGMVFYYRTPANRYHTLIIRSPVFKVHEVTGGPFRKDQTYSAPWAPEDTDIERWSYWEHLIEKVEGIIR
jgi:cupin fold WbuC family metalloprotein